MKYVILQNGFTQGRTFPFSRKYQIFDSMSHLTNVESSNYEFLMKHEYDPTKVGFIPIYVPEYRLPFTVFVKSSQHNDSTFLDGTPGNHTSSICCSL